MSEEFKPKFNEKLFEELMNDTPTFFKSPYSDDPLNFRKEFVKNILIDIRDVYYFGYDVFQVSQGDEGSGKSTFIGEVAFVYHHFMKLLGLINWDWSLKVCYGSLDKMLDDMDKKRFQPHEFYVLDEGDELAGENFMQPAHKRFRIEMRRGRKFARFVFINLPQAKELSHRLITTRCQKLYEIEVDRDLQNFNIKKGEWSMIAIPRGRKGYSYYNDTEINKNFIRNELSELLKSKQEFITFPEKLISLKGRFKGIPVWNPQEYKRKMAMETSDIFRIGHGQRLTKKQEEIVLKVFDEVAELRLIHQMFKDDVAGRRAFYDIKKKLLSNISE